MKEERDELRKSSGNVYGKLHFVKKSEPSRSLILVLCVQGVSLLSVDKTIQTLVVCSHTRNQYRRIGAILNGTRSAACNLNTYIRSPRDA